MQGKAAAQLGGEGLFAAFFGAIDEFLRGSLFVRVAAWIAGENVAEQLAVCRSERRLEGNGFFEAGSSEGVAGLKLGVRRPQQPSWPDGSASAA